MIANWSRVLSRLQTQARQLGVRLPDRPRVDGRWHSCDDGPGAYVLGPRLPFIALIVDHYGAAHVWRANPERILTRAQEHVIADLINRRPVPLSGCSSPGSTPDDRLGRKSLRGRTILDAKKVLNELLAGDGVRTIEIRAHTEAAGFAWSTVRRASKVLNVNVTRLGFGKSGGWWWSLPSLEGK